MLEMLELLLLSESRKYEFNVLYLRKN